MGRCYFDSCIRYLGEDPWDRIRKIKEVMPKTPQQMLFRAQNILGYRHYADDVVKKFIDRCAINGISVFRIFDAMNDARNLETAIEHTVSIGQHAQGTLSYTTSPVHTIDLWLDLAKRIENMGANSICIKDMAGLLQPYVAYELVKKLKENITIPIQLHAHATTGLSTASIIKSIEAGIDRVDTSIGSMSMTYGHSATNTIVSILEYSERKTKLNLQKLDEIDNYFREIRKKYVKFEGSLRGVDSRILSSQVPGGMLTNMESQLKQQNALHRFDEVLKEMIEVRKDLGYIPLVTPTSQIVGTQAVINVLSNERYKTITKETSGILKGEYGATPAEVNKDLQKKVLKDGKVITCRPADLIDNELDNLNKKFDDLVKENNIELSKNKIDDLLTYVLFPKVGIDFLKNRNNKDYFELSPEKESNSDKKEKQGVYTVTVEGKSYTVQVSEGGNITTINNAPPKENSNNVVSSTKENNFTTEKIEYIKAPLAGTIIKINIEVNQAVKKGDTLLVIEAMKMETEIKSTDDGYIKSIYAKENDTVTVEQNIISLIKK